MSGLVGHPTDGETGETAMSNEMKATRYRKKPVVIEAMRLHAASMWDVLAWCGSAGGAEIVPDPNGGATTLQIATLEGVMSAQMGDYVIRGVQGEFYPCKPDVFRATYERADGGHEPKIGGAAPAVDEEKQR